MTYCYYYGTDHISYCSIVSLLYCIVVNITSCSFFLYHLCTTHKVVCWLSVDCLYRWIVKWLYDILTRLHWTWFIWITKLQVITIYIYIYMYIYVYVYIYMYMYIYIYIHSSKSVIRNCWDQSILDNWNVQITEVAPMLLKLTQLYDTLGVKNAFLSRKCVVEGLQLLLVPNSIVDCWFLRVNG